MRSYSVLVNSCDAYSDIWPFFFHVLNKTWPGKKPCVYLNTETKQYTDPNLEVKVLNSPKTLHWGERLLNCLNKINEDYVLLLLEDFIFEEKIKIEYIEKALECLRKNSNIYAMQLVVAGECANRDYVPKYEMIDGFSRRKKIGMFKIIAGPTLWRRDDLIRLTRGDDTPWDWEYFGSYRTIFYGKDCYCYYKKDSPIFDYDLVHGGAIHRGKWVGYKVRELERKYNFKVNYGQRKIVEDWLGDDKEKNIPVVYKRLPSVLRNQAKKVYNLLYGAYLKIINC